MTSQGTWQEKIKTRSRKLIAHVSNWRYGRPAKHLTLIGVTGTKGKTITTQMIYHVLQTSGLPSGYISTVAAKIGDQELDTGLHVTSPEPWDMPRYLRAMVDQGVKYVVIEATSQGLQQGRLAGLWFKTAVITNIDSDHLDYHQSWENYAESKFQLVEQLAQEGVVVLNRDHVSSDWLSARAELLQQNVLASWFSKTEVSDFAEDFTGMKFSYQGVPFQVQVFGSHMLENVLATIKACTSYLDLPTIAQALESYQLPVGRMQVMQRTPFTVIVDFAHTLDSVERSLSAIYELKSADSRIITLFGCAGDRDRSRRMMGVSAAKFSKVVILTAEDPRTESLAEINSEIMRLAESVGGVLVARFGDHEQYATHDLVSLKQKIRRVIDNQDIPFIAFDQMTTDSRADAIHLALQIALPQDIVYITGKGHERSLCFGTTEYDWSDQAAVAQIIAGSQ